MNYKQSNYSQNKNKKILMPWMAPITHIFRARPGLSVLIRHSITILMPRKWLITLMIDFTS